MVRQNKIITEGINRSKQTASERKKETKKETNKQTENEIDSERKK